MTYIDKQRGLSLLCRRIINVECRGNEGNRSSLSEHHSKNYCKYSYKIRCQSVKAFALSKGSTQNMYCSWHFKMNISSLPLSVPYWTWARLSHLLLTNIERKEEQIHWKLANMAILCDQSWTESCWDCLPTSVRPYVCNLKLSWLPHDLPMVPSAIRTTKLSFKK